MSATSTIAGTDLRQAELIKALKLAAGELEKISRIRYDERLDYASLYRALETSQAALVKIEASVPRPPPVKAKRRI